MWFSFVILSNGCILYGNFCLCEKKKKDTKKLKIFYKYFLIHFNM